MFAHTKHRTVAVAASAAALLCGAGAGIALASPDGDDDPAYNAAGVTGFGSQYSPLVGGYQSVGPPVSTQDRTAAGAGSSVTAALVTTESNRSRIVQTWVHKIQFTRYAADGKPVSGFGSQGIVLANVPTFSGVPTALLDIRVLDSGNIVVLMRASETSSPDASMGSRLWVVTYDANGNLSTTESANQRYAAPNASGCPERSAGRAAGQDRADIHPPYDAYVDAARVEADGGVAALWDCFLPPATAREGSARSATGHYMPSGYDASVFAAYYQPGATDDASHDRVDSGDVQANFGQDLELGPTGDPYVLVGHVAPDTVDRARQTVAGDSSQVFHYRVAAGGSGARGVAPGTLLRQPPTGGSDPADLPGLPIDLAVDHQSRPVVWTKRAPNWMRGGSYSWVISRLGSDLSVDTGWGTDGVAAVTDPRLGPADVRYYNGINTPFYLTVRPDDRVLVTGPDVSTADRSAGRAADSYGDAIIAGLTSAGQTDTGFGDAATPGFKALSYVTPDATSAGQEVDSSGFVAIGEPKLQSDGKVFLPHFTSVYLSSEGTGTQTTGTERIAPPPVDAGESSQTEFMGVTRLRLPGSQPVSTGAGSRPVSPSSVPAICGRRAISLVRADVRGRKVRLTGLVGSAFYGKKVTIQTDPTGAKASAYSKTATVTASKSTGSFSVSVPRPKASVFKNVRYRATVGRAKSPALKLPQSLTSRSVRSSKGTITIKGRVKRSVLGKRNKVKIRRLACGRYRTVGTARPDRNGNYSVTFAATALRGVSFYRAEAVVQVRPGSKKYAIQYARAIAIRTTSQTG